jgi:aerobic-type carbon monoxide dehydrogenase small subunit (CoxS/CutS family)
MKLKVNGKNRTVDVHPMKRLLDVIREDCGLTGTKEGCGEGECGACTVLIDGVAVDSCITPAAHAEGRSVVTIEGAANTRLGKALQNAFVEHGGAQCGICTPGMILAAAPLKPGASLHDIKTALAGNLCRCTGYPAIFRSVETALKAGLRSRASGLSSTKAGLGSRASGLSNTKAGTRRGKRGVRA